MGALLDRFVCVRAIQCYGMDLSLFQFDYQLTWCAFFLNADRTIYGRYGTRSGHDGMKDISMEGFKKALQGALELHAVHPRDREALAAKTGPSPRWKTPEAMPPLAHYKKGDTSRQGCIHCHKIHSGEISSRRRAAEAPADRSLWVYPMPEVLGLALDPAETAVVRSVAPGSAAEKAGFRARDRILRLSGQPVISIADVQWVLHNAPDAGELKAQVERAGKETALVLPLGAGWRRAGEFAWRAVGWTVGQNFVGFRCEPLPAAERKEHRIEDGALALRIKSVIPDWLKEGNRAIFKSGIKKGDLIVEVDGLRSPMSESEFLAYISQKKKPGETVSLAILRQGKREVVELPLQ